MDSIEVNEKNVQELITERNNCLPSLISSLDEIDHCGKILENVNICSKYISTYNISNINQELLQYLVRAVKKCLLKIYDDNLLLSDTVEDEFVVKILKENLHVAVGFIKFLKIVLEFLIQNSDISLCNLNSTPTSFAQLISSTFKHCKNSTDMYKQSFNAELLELFRITQEVHLLFLKLFETYIVVKNEPENTEDIKTLTEVLDIICGMSETLSELNVKSMSDNWKGYTAITNKFSSILLYSIDLKLPISYLTYEVDKNLSSIERKNEIDANLVAQVVKITSFLIKVVLKICDIFWNCIDGVQNEVLKFCCTVYSFPVERYRSEGHPSDTLMLIADLIFKTLEPLLLRLLNDSLSLKIFSVENFLPDETPFGHVNFLNNILRVLVSYEVKSSSLNINGIINAIFNNINLCFAELFWDSEPSDSLFDSLVLHISAAVIIYDEYFGEVESILLKSLLQEHIFRALLAIEVWTLLLSNSTPQFCLSTLINLIRECEEINFGLFTHRPDHIYLKCFVQRLFKILPNYTKNDFVLQYNPVRCMDYWKVIQFGSFPVQQRLSIEGICMAMVEKVEAMGRGNLSFQDFTFIAENFGALSTVNFREIGLNPNNLAKAVLRLWTFHCDGSEIVGNNMLKYFVPELCKITGALACEFDSRQLTTVLSQMKSISSDDSYKLVVCDFLSILSNRPNENNQDNIKLVSLMADIICQNLLIDASNVIRQETLKVIRNFIKNGKRDVAKTILQSSKDMKNDICDYLERKAITNKFDKEYLARLGSITFHHECIKWKNESDFPKTKKMRMENLPAVVEEIKLPKREAVSVKKQPLKSSKWCNFVETTTDPDENKQDGNISDVIGNIKGEVKCLVNVLKTEKMTAKNASDIRLIANQLLSFL